MITAWLNPYDGIEYEIGEKIPVYQATGGGLVYGAECVRLEDPGFPGVIEMKDGGRFEFNHSMGMSQIKKWLIPALEGDPDWFYIGPAEPGWRMYFARCELNKSRAIEMGNINKMLDD